MDIEVDIEEGELSEGAESVSEEAEPADVEYSPLVRPVTLYPKGTSSTVSSAPASRVLQKPKPKAIWGSESDSSGTEDSDEDGPGPAKRMMTHSAATGVASNIKKNNIWGNVVFEQSIEKDIQSFGVAKRQNAIERDVESYAFKRFDENGKELVDQDSDQDVDDQNEAMDESKDDYGSLLAQMRKQHGVKRRLRKSKPKKKGSPLDPRILKPLETSVDDNEEEIAKDMQEKLFEKNSDLILRAVQILGKEAVIRIFNATRDVEETGGMKVADGTRRRTSGGIFFYLLRKDPHIPMDKIKSVFKEESKEQTTMRKKLKAQRYKQHSNALKRSMGMDTGMDKSRGEILLEKVNELASRQEQCDEAEMGEICESSNVFSDATPTPVPSPVDSADLLEDPYDDCITIGELEPL